jgi:hypothetical protein
MSSPVHHEGTGLSSRHCWFLGVAWLLIALKCVIITWAIRSWQVPIHPLWLVLPTLMFAALATVLWVSHRE